MKLSITSLEKIEKLKEFYKGGGIYATEEDVLEILITEGYKSIQRELKEKMAQEQQ